MWFDSIDSGNSLGPFLLLLRHEDHVPLHGEFGLLKVVDHDANEQVEREKVPTDDEQHEEIDVAQVHVTQRLHIDSVGIHSSVH